MNLPADPPGQEQELQTAAELWAYAQNYALVAAVAGLLLIPVVVLWRRRGSPFLPLQRLRWIHWGGLEVTQAILYSQFVPVIVVVSRRQFIP